MKNKIYAMTSNFSQVILPIVVFGGLGLGALAFVDSLNYRANLCRKVSFYTNCYPKLLENFKLALMCCSDDWRGWVSNNSP